MSRKTINPDQLFNSLQHGFSQITTSEPGKHVFISGQVAWDENANIVGKDDLEIQTMQSMANLKTAMQVAGGTLEDIVMLRIYLVNFKQEDGSIITNALKETFGTQNPPSSTWINVQGLANEDFLVEVEAHAVIQL